MNRLRKLLALLFAAGTFLFIAPAFRADEGWIAPPVPLGLPADTWSYYIPKNNSLTAAKVELGRKLFFDTRLSSDGKISCSSCHKPELAFTDGRDVAEGVSGKRGTRNSISLFNVIFNASQFWDGRADTLEQQASEPLINPLEMGNKTKAEVIERLRGIQEYCSEFKSVFGKDVNLKDLERAIAAYERTLVSGDAPIDRFVAGDERAISDEARRGFAIFRGRGRCSRCHSFSEQRPFFTDFAYHNTGVAANHPNFDKLARKTAAAIETGIAKELIDNLAAEDGGQELGRILHSYLLFDLGAYRTPSLRNVAITAPYFHDGSAKTLVDVVKFYNAGGRPNLNLEEELHPLGLNESEERELVAFLKTLTGGENVKHAK